MEQQLGGCRRRTIPVGSARLISMAEWAFIRIIVCIIVNHPAMFTLDRNRRHVIKGYIPLRVVVDG